MIFTYFFKLSVLSELYKLSTTYFHNQEKIHYFYIRKHNKGTAQKRQRFSDTADQDNRKPEPPAQAVGTQRKKRGNQGGSGSDGEGAEPPR